MIDGKIAKILPSFSIKSHHFVGDEHKLCVTNVFLNSDLSEFTHMKVLTAVTCMNVCRLMMSSRGSLHSEEYWAVAASL